MAEPNTRSLEKVIEALDIVEDEFGFQVMRLTEHVRPRTEEEQKFHDELKEGYKSSQAYTRLLRRYHQGRLDRLRSSGTTAVMETDEGGIDSLGRAQAFTGDEG